jgi:predicted enzyme related to lactoylglutathione lyase
MFNAIKVCIYVDNQERAIEFYTKKLGFEVAVTHSMGPQGNWVELVHNRGQLRLVPYPRSMMPDWQERKPSIVFSCEDVSALYEELSARGVQFKGKPTKMGWGNFAHLVDPDGNEFGLSDAPLSKS